MNQEDKMVTCNLCKENKKLSDIKSGFRYVCQDCWEKITIDLDGVRQDKELLY